MTEELAAVIADGTVHQYGTFNGNPLVMAAAEATLTEVLTADAYDAARARERAPAGRMRRDHRALRAALLHRGHRRQGLCGLLVASRCASTATT